MKSHLRPVTRTQVALAYESSEMHHILKAVGQLPPYFLHREKDYIRIDCHSLLGGRWRCGFHFSQQKKPSSWVLKLIEHDSYLTLSEALSALGMLEEIGLKKIKFGA